MYASLNWLSQLLGRELDADDTARRLTMLGATVDSVEAVYAELASVTPPVDVETSFHCGAE